MDDNGMTNRDTVKANYEEEADYYDTLYEESADRYPNSLLRANLAQSVIDESDDVESIIDIGCGTGQVLIQLLDSGYDVEGVDFAENMVRQGKNNLQSEGYNPDLIRQGDVMAEVPFDREYDAAIALGVLPHFEDIRKPLMQFHGLLKNDGLLVAQLRNDLFDMFTLNQYSYDFVWNELLSEVSLGQSATKAMEDRLRDVLNLEDGVGDSAGDAGFESGEHQHYSNPLNIDGDFAASGFSIENILFHHYHAMLPEFESTFRQEMYEQSLKLEDPNDWRGHFLASAFLVHARAK